MSNHSDKIDPLILEQEDYEAAEYDREGSGANTVSCGTCTMYVLIAIAAVFVRGHLVSALSN